MPGIEQAAVSQQAIKIHDIRGYIHQLLRLYEDLKIQASEYPEICTLIENAKNAADNLLQFCNKFLDEKKVLATNKSVADNKSEAMIALNPELIQKLITANKKLTQQLNSQPNLNTNETHTLINIVVDNIKQLDPNSITTTGLETVDLKEWGKYFIARCQTTNNEAVTVNLIDKTPGFYVLLDKNLLDRILMNLMNNALKFTKKGHITLTLEINTHNQLSFTIKDTGAGIHPDDLPNVLNPYQQANKSIAKTHGGTGIGLGASKSAIEKEMKGTFADIKSTLNEGTTISFTSSPPLIMASHRPQQKSKGKILIADDQLINLKLFLPMLPDYELIMFINGRDAADYLANPLHGVDVVLLDMEMPIMDGVEASKQICKHRHNNKNQIIGLSGDLAKVQKAELRTFLIKPYKRENVRQAIKAIFAENALTQQSNITTDQKHTLPPVAFATPFATPTQLTVVLTAEPVVYPNSASASPPVPPLSAIASTGTGTGTRTATSTPAVSSRSVTVSEDTDNSTCGGCLGFLFGRTAKVAPAPQLRAK